MHFKGCCSGEEALFSDTLLETFAGSNPEVRSPKTKSGFDLLSDCFYDLGWIGW